MKFKYIWVPTIHYEKQFFLITDMKLKIKIDLCQFGRPKAVFVSELLLFSVSCGEELATPQLVCDGKSQGPNSAIYSVIINSMYTLQIPVFFPGESHGQRSLAGYIPWGRRVGHDWATEPLSTHILQSRKKKICHTTYSLNLMWPWLFISFSLFSSLAILANTRSKIFTWRKFNSFRV